MIARLLRTLHLHRLHLDMERKLAWRKLARSIRAEAAREGVSTEWKRRGELCRAMFGEGVGGL